VKNWNLSGVPKQPYQHEVIERIKKAGYLDAAVITQKEQIHTVPVTQDSDVVYHDLRLDYVFLSNSLAERTVDYRVIINEITRVCSDHYPIIAYIQ
jgi:endonuclease/exonuclease/phosphatase family metal-dependent hydrolase